MNAVHFISDVHLGIGDAPHERGKTRRLLDLLRRVPQESERLVIAGDLFDFWFEYAHVLPRGHHAVLAAIGDLVEKGVTVDYLVGNHDFAVGDFFRKDLGVHVHERDLSFESQNRTFYVYHGDGLAAKDHAYRLLKKIIRAGLSKALFRLLHPDLGFMLAKRFSSSSRDYTSTKYYGETDGMYLEAQRRLLAGTDYVIMGHRHRPAMLAVGDGWYVNLGDWLTHYSYAVFRGGTMALYTCVNDKEELLPL